jgi:hypothetical protein
MNSNVSKVNPSSMERRRNMHSDKGGIMAQSNGTIKSLSIAMERLLFLVILFSSFMLITSAVVAPPSQVWAADELCNGLDDDEDGQIDEDFTDLGDDCAAFSDPPGCSLGDPGGCCLSGDGEKVCSEDGSTTVCEAYEPDALQAVWSAEGPQGDPSCFDFRDNNCDDLVDHQDPGCTTPDEVGLCDGFDNDNDGPIDEDFPNLGADCTVGDGECERTGVFICSEDGTATVCSKSQGAPGKEGPPGHPSCSDNKDNDCDGLTDLLDTQDCTSDEVCDGLDNDDDGETDEDFPNLGDSCTVGDGECENAGVYVCTADETSTVCNASPGVASTEGPSGETCSDGLDNDCDGLTDDLDPNCNSADLAVRCALPYTHGKPGWDCTGKHIIQYEFDDPSGTAMVRAELLALDTDGTVLGVLPVRDGDPAHLASRLDPDDFQWVTKSNRHRDSHTVFAPVPLLRVTVDDGVNRAQAFCSNIPYLETIKPSGEVISAAEGSALQVVAAIPRVDPETLFVKIDGVDLLDEMSIDPATDFPGGPYTGTVDVNGHFITVSDLVVQVDQSSLINEPSSNTLTMTLSNLPCGGHVVVVSGDRLPGIITDDTTLDCNRDDLSDKGTFSVFAIEISSPYPGEITDDIPTPVEGKVCHGREITTVMVNGKSLSVSGQTLIPGDGEDSGDTYELEIETELPQTNLVDDVFGSPTGLGTFDPGSNKLHALAEDDQGNRTTTSVHFAVGDVTPITAGLSQAQLTQIKGLARSTVEGEIRELVAAQAVEIDNALVLGLEPSAINTFFEETCATASATAEAKLRETLLNQNIPGKTVALPDPICDPYTTVEVVDVRFNTDLACEATLAENEITVAVRMPAIAVDVNVEGYKKIKELGICWCEVIVSMDSTGTIADTQVDFPLTGEQFTAGGESTGTLTPGTVSFEVTRDDNEINCFVGAVLDVFNGILNFIIFIFSFGQASPIDLTPSFEGVFSEVDLTEKLGVQEFVIKIQDITLNEKEVTDTDKLLDVELAAVTIEPEGLTASLTASFAPTSEDLEVKRTPGALFFMRDLPPMPPVSGAGNTYFVISDNALNQLFASMTTQGEMKTICSASGTCTAATPPETVGNSCTSDAACGSGGTCELRTMDDLLPDDCNSIPAILPWVRGFCLAVKGGDCETLFGPLEQGSCHGYQGADCEQIPVEGSPPSVEKITCRNTFFNNLRSEDPLLFCARADVPPYVLIQDDVDLNGDPLTTPTPDVVETHFRVNDLLVGLIVDRGGDGVSGEINANPGCFQSDVDTSGDCNLLATCLDLNFPINLSLDTTDNKLKIVPEVQAVQIPARDEGQVCEGGFNFGGDLEVLNESASSKSINDLQVNVNLLVPALQTDGLDLGGIVRFSDPRMFAIDMPGVGAPGFQDYLGITGDIEAAVP